MYGLLMFAVACLSPLALSAEHNAGDTNSGRGRRVVTDTEGRNMVFLYSFPMTQSQMPTNQFAGSWQKGVVNVISLNTVHAIANLSTNERDANVRLRFQPNPDKNGYKIIAHPKYFAEGGTMYEVIIYGGANKITTNGEMDAIAKLTERIWKELVTLKHNEQ